MTLTPEQQVVYDWLYEKLNLPVFAEAYKGALQLLSTRSPGYVTFVSHTGRDIMNILAPLIVGIERTQVQYHKHLDRLQDMWKDKWGGPGLTGQGDAGGGHLIPYPTCQIVKDLIDEHRIGRDRNNRADTIFFSTFLDYEDLDEIPPNFLQEWKSARRWFLGHAHLREAPFQEDAASETERHFRVLHSLLYVAAGREYERLKAIDEILEETN